MILDPWLNSLSVSTDSSATTESIATPFEWKFTRQHLAALLELLKPSEAHRPAA